MSWAVLFNPLVKKDLKAIPRSDQKLILNACRKKLATHPEQYGKPLRGEFHGLWKLKIRHYRVIYQIRKKEIKVLVIKIGFRRDDIVYKELSSIIGKGKINI